jgi:hypothetical protein
MEITISSQPVECLKRDGLVLNFFSDERPPRGYCGLVDWRLNGLISKQIACGKISGSFTEQVLITPRDRIPASRILLFGLGHSSDMIYDRVYAAGQTIARTVLQIDCDDIAMDIPGTDRCHLDAAETTTAMISGFADSFWSIRDRSCHLNLCILGYDTYRDEITLGANQFKVNVKNQIKVSIREV